MKSIFYKVCFFFDSAAVKISGGVAVGFYFMVMLHEYIVEVGKIDKTSLELFGGKLSSQLSFFEILDSAGFSCFWVALKCLVFVFFPVIILIHLIRRCIQQERHPGWRRIGFVAPAVLIVWQLLSVRKFSAPEFVWLSLILTIFALTAIVVTRWVLSGFAKREDE